MPHLIVAVDVEACKDETFGLCPTAPLSRDNRKISWAISTTRLLELFLAIAALKEPLTRWKPSRTYFYIANSWAVGPQPSIETRLRILTNFD
jgi:hypothetical protein